MMDEKILNRAKEWLSDSFDEDTRNKIKELIDKNDENTLTDMFYKDLEFGTGGMRGIMGPGTNRMNIYTVGRASQGLANYLKDNIEDAESRGIAIAYDSRNNSKLFAREAASVFAANGIHAYIFPELRPTPLLSYTVMHLKTAAGVVITASHNPKEYNGYKVYCSEGYQVTPPEDSRIVEYVNKVRLVKDVKRIDYEEGKSRGLIEELEEAVDRSYLDKVESFREMIESGLELKDDSAVKVVYTPLHGTGITLVPRALERIRGVEIIKEEKQSIPDGNFPTTPSPNPEEVSALSRAIELAANVKADMVIATDPDCDRMGLAVPDSEGNYIPLNGNQIGTMFSYIIAESLSKSGKMPENPTVVTTIVSTELVEKIVKDYDIDVIYTLTGFKYIGEKMYQFKQSGSRNFIFGFEESYGYLADNFVRDKDGVIASVLAVILVKYAALKYGSVVNFLEDIYRKYGMYLEFQKSFLLKGIEGAERIKSIMDKLRKNPPKSIAGSNVVLIKDYLEQKEFSADGTVSGMIEGLPKSNVLQFYTDDNVKISVRPSGTEPKIKFYFAIVKPFNRSMNDTRKEIEKKYDEVQKDIFSFCGLE